MTLQITQADIDEATMRIRCGYEYPTNCPTAVAFTRITGLKCRVGLGTIQSLERKVLYNMPCGLTNQILGYCRSSQYSFFPETYILTPPTLP